MAKQIKLKVIQDTKTLEIPNKITNFELLEQEILKAQNSKELIEPSIKIDALRKAFNKAMDVFKEEQAKQKAIADVIKDKLDSAISIIKEQALKVVEVKTVQKTNKKTGEVTTKPTHNLDTKIFSFTKGKKTAIVDNAEILANPSKYSKFLKQEVTYKLDTDAIAKAEASKLPWTEKVKPDAISFKKITSDNIIKLKEQLKLDAKKEVK